MAQQRTTRDGAAPRVDRREFLTGGLRVGGVAALAALGADALGTPAAGARRRIPAHRRAAGPPNILVIMVDQLRTPRWFGAGSATSLPPNIAALARGGVSFVRHYTASNDCTPARAAMLTGLHTHQTGCMITGASTLDPGFPTWGTLLRDHGYTSYWYGKWHLTHGDRFWNLIDGPPALASYGFDGGTYPSPNGAPAQGWRADRLIAEEFDAWYAQAAGDGPWCTTVSFVNPHDIAWWWRWSRRSAVEASAPPAIVDLPPNFETPAQLTARRKPLVQQSLQDTSGRAFGEVPWSGPGLRAGWLPFLDLYVKLQREVDRHVGRVMATLASRRAVMKNTVVIFTSDHGEYGSSHGLRGKGAGMYEEAINVPLIVADHSGRLAARPGVRRQLTSSVDLAPLLLTIAAGSHDWRSQSRYAHIATRPDLAAIVRDPLARGRAYALHATDEVMTEFALSPYAADAPLHITGVITPTAKYVTYSNWRPNTTEALAQGEQTELYDHTTREGYLELDNLAGRSHAEAPLRATLERAIRDELHAPLAPALDAARRRGIAEYHRLAAGAVVGSDIQRLRAVEQIVAQIERFVTPPVKKRRPPAIAPAH